MKYPSEPNEPEHNAFVQAALNEASHYEAETEVPVNLVADAMARHERSGRDCKRPRLIPGRIALAFGMLLLTGIAIRLQMPSRLSSGSKSSPWAVIDSSDIKTVLPIPAAWAHLDFADHALPPIDIDRWTFTANPRNRHRIALPGTRHHRRPRFARRFPAPVPATPSSVWKTETVQVEVVTQTVTPVWVAQPDPATATVALTPALFQVALRPEEDADTTASPVATQLIPIRFEQENTQP